MEKNEESRRVKLIGETYDVLHGPISVRNKHWATVYRILTTDHTH